MRHHIDEFGGEELGKRIFGLVIRSDGHILHSESLCGPTAVAIQMAGVSKLEGACCLDCGGIELKEGDLYGLDPHDRHWTTCPGNGQLIFAATFLPLDDPRCIKPKKLAHDLHWETVAARCNSLQRQRQEKADERYRHRGIGEVELPDGG